ncbi:MULTISPECIES: hypothetical protein [Pseudomonas]|uniref:Uncharacterized protein n=1 Tax=Pseudomonas putida NBRC 14164 TaxID=1211579 RepID=A0ABN5UNT4_PSEPU|nr:MULTISPECIES: hypothetical protein [Pseudomonas]MCX9135589.1 hypothetical protein [Pseudomonas sp. DCB_PUT]MDD1969582.1 hypothetical protein [Pseudomonas putida]MDO1464813.1 hypothetical protein [Pseudomonas putida]MDO1470183.1 hypothetical protein [Pseudomonas putida]MDZ7325907.1 hypothetical protein [Pseudomonas sp. SDS3-8]
MDKATVTADTLELILLNQQALRAGIEELSLWIKQRGSTATCDNVMIALQTMDANAEGIEQGIRVLRG